MKKNTFLTLSLGALLAGSALAVAASNKAVGAKAVGTYAGEYSNAPASGEVASDSFIGNAWHTTVGARRIDDRAVIVTDTSNWGFRAKYKNDKKFDCSDFSFTYDVSQLIDGTVLCTIMGATPGAYASENSMITVDILESLTDAHTYRVTCSTGGLHNISIESFTDGTTWADDANFEGVTITAPDDVISVKLKRVNSTLSRVTVNDNVFEVQTSELYKNFVDDYNAYYAIGMFNNASTVQSYIVEQIGDAADEVYYSAEGDFGKAKVELNELKTTPLTTVDQIIAAKEKLDSCAYTRLYAWDKSYFAELFGEVESRINAAVASAANTVAIKLFANKVTAFEEACNDLSTVEKAQVALNAYLAAQSALEGVNIAALEGDDLTVYNTAKAKYDENITKLLAGFETVYEASVAAFESKVANAVSNVDVAAAYSLKNSIPTYFSEYLADAKIEAWSARVDAAMALLTEKTTFTHDNWEQGSTSRVIENNGELQIMTYGSADTTGSGVFAGSELINKEKISASDFEMVINIQSLPESNGSWLTIGIMEKPEMWILDDTDKVQENKGIFFLIARIDSIHLRVQAFLCSLTSNRFYDSPLSQTLSVDYTNDIKISFKEVSKTIAGVTDTYFEMSFNDQSFDQEVITSRKIKTVLGSTKEGYLVTASSGVGQKNPILYTIKTINGVAANASSIVKAVDKTPTSTDTEKTFVYGSASATVSFAIDTKDLEISKIEVDNAAIASSNYTVGTSKITLKNAFLKTLSVGDHTVKATTSAGSVSWTLHVIDNGSGETTSSEDPGESSGGQTSKGGCRGSIIATSAIISVVSVLGICLLANKKKEN